MLNHLFPRIGFAQTVRACGSLSSALLHPSSLALTDISPHVAAYVVAGVLVTANILMRARYPPIRRDSNGKETARPSPKKLMKEPRYAFSVLGLTLICLGIFFPLSYIQGELSPQL